MRERSRLRIRPCSHVEVRLFYLNHFLNKKSGTARSCCRPTRQPISRKRSKPKRSRDPIQGFARFLMTLAAASGRILDLSKLANQAKVSRTSCVRYVEILEDTLIAQRVTSFHQAESADTVRHSKLYFFDVGVLNGLLNNFSIEGERKGLLFEHAVYAQLRNSAMAHDVPIEIQYFRTRHGVEVDFIVTLRGRVWAIEAKSGEVAPHDLNGVIAFRQYFPEVYQCVVVNLTGPKRVRDGVIICDLTTLLQEMGL